LKKSHKNVTGRRIREARIFRNPPFSQADLASCLTKRGVHLDQGAISRIENRVRNVSDYELVAIARCLGVSLDRLCGTRSP
jgi:transcriptional regulator with XRE-family HTH domain